jgi:hypothetical protein
MPSENKESRRENRARVLRALKSETGSMGGDAAKERVRAFLADPVGAPTKEFAFVGALTLTRFYVAQGKPNATERKSLWQTLREEFSAPDATDPQGWSGETNVAQLQAIFEEA